MAEQKELLRQMVADGRAGKGPRAFFGGYVHYHKPADDGDFYAGLVKALPADGGRGGSSGSSGAGIGWILLTEA